MERRFSVERLCVGPLSTNAYLLKDPESRECVVIDPGAEPGRLASAVEREALRPVAILLTHGHIDHVMAVPELQKLFDIPVYIHREERQMLESLPAQALMFGFPRVEHFTVSQFLEEGELQLGTSFSLVVLHTPGHSPGSCCFLADQEIFSGDTLFELSIGRTDLPGGDFDQLIRSIREKLFKLPDECSVFPGHGLPTTIGREKKLNPFLRGAL